ncbi:MAG: ABC transporter permease subunit [Verrucomicrobia bacterium]|nr:ABC transporter permease subunit [Verrucomicrobiota bacterium]
MPGILWMLLLPLTVTGTLRSQPVLRWAADPNSNAPYTFYDQHGKLAGFEYEIIQAVAHRLGRRAEFVQNDWAGLIPGLGRGLYDCVICGVEITPDKAQEVLFTNPYYVTYEQLVSRRGAPPVASLDQLRGRAIGTLDQTAALRMLENTPGVMAKTYDQEVNAYADVANGRIFGVLLDFPIAKYYAAPDPALQFSGPPFGDVLYGIAIRKGNDRLQREINQALAELAANGQLRDILSRWGLWTPAVASAFGQPETPSGPDTEYQAFVAARSGPGTWWSGLRHYLAAWPLLLRASLLTLEIALAGIGVAIAVGLVLAVLRVFGPWPLSFLATLYIELIRGTPLLIQLLIIFYGLPNLGIRLSPFVAGVLGLGLNYAAYEAENYRAGLLAVPNSQSEAARALGMTHLQALRFVVLPQAFRVVLPPLTNDFISLLKDSSLVSMVTLVELTGAYNRIATQTFDYFGTGLLVAAIYLLIGLPFVRLARFTEAKLAMDPRRPTQRPGLVNLPESVPHRYKVHRQQSPSRKEAMKKRETA